MYLYKLLVRLATKVNISLQACNRISSEDNVMETKVIGICISWTFNDLKVILGY